VKTVFLNSHRSHKVEPQSGVHARANNHNDPAGGATPVVLPLPTTDEQIMMAAEQPHRPWLIQGMRNAL
jgi:hypothetical protein